MFQLKHNHHYWLKMVLFSIIHTNLTLDQGNPSEVVEPPDHEECCHWRFLIKTMESLFNSLCDYLSENRPLKELEFILSSEAVILWKEGHMGIPSHVILPLFNFGWNKFKCDRSNLRVLNALCCLNPECYSLWNARKDLLKSKIVTAGAEIDFCQFLLSKHPSKGRIWEHLRWILINQELALAILPSNICSKSADRYKCNYPSWNFRRSFQSVTMDEVQSIF